eukprot:6175358-Pleurochrysis_carterae.AAC.4
MAREQGGRESWGQQNWRQSIWQRFVMRSAPARNKRDMALAHQVLAQTHRICDQGSLRSLLAEEGRDRWKHVEGT